MSAKLPSQIGKFTIVRLLGSGAMGRVYLAEDPDIGRKVAIKVLAGSTDQDAINRFRVEAQAVGKLIHPNIVMLLEFGVHDDAPFLVMEYLRGEDLDRWALADHPLDQQLRVLLGLCRALRYAHSKQVLHRDIKPGNIHVLPDGEPKLMDFGIAKLAGTAMTATGMLIGTPEFMAPELLKNQPASKASDHYATALVGYYLLTGHRPFKADSVGSCLARVMEAKITPLQELRQDLPLPLCQSIMAYLQPIAEDRPRSLNPLIEMLERPQVTSTGRDGDAASESGSATTMIASETTKLKPNSGRKWWWRGFGWVTFSVAMATAWNFSPHWLEPLPRDQAVSPATPVHREAAHPASQDDALNHGRVQPPPAKPATDQPVVVKKPATRIDVPASEHGNSGSPQQTRNTEDKPSAEDNGRPASHDRRSPAKRPHETKQPPAGAAVPTAGKPDQEPVPPPARSGAEIPVAQDQAGQSKTSTAVHHETINPAVATENTDLTTSGKPAPLPITRLPPVLTDITPHRLHRNQMVSLIIAGNDLDGTRIVRILSGTRAARGFDVVRVKLIDSHHLQVSLHVAASTRLGRYRLTTSNADQQTSNALSLQVTL